MHSARFSIKATSTRLCQIKDRSPDPPPAHIMMLIMEPISRRLCHAPVTNLFLARRQHQCVMHSDWQKMKRKAIYALSLSHTLSCRFITFQIKLSFQPRLPCSCLGNQQGVSELAPCIRIACISLPVDLIILA